MSRFGRSRAAVLATAAILSARIVAGAGSGASAGPGTASPADAPTDSKEACFHAVDDGQHLRTARKLVTARDQFIQCARSGCPALVRKDCAQWLSEVEVALPSVVFAARDVDGRDVLDVHVSVDGNLVAGRLEGASVPVDPGPHVFRFEWEGHGAVEQQTVIREGEKSRLLAVSFPASEKPGKGIPVGVWVFGALGVIGGGGFAALALSGQSDVSNLRSTCAPNCSSSQVDGARTQIILANVSLGVGIASLGIATTWFLLSRSHEGKTAALSVEPSPGGGRANLVFSY